MEDDADVVEVSRRHLLRWVIGGAVAVVGAGSIGVELVERGVVPGKQFLDEIDGACSVPPPAITYGVLGVSTSGQFYSRARRRDVGYTLAYPTGHAPGDELAVIVMLHGYGGTHADAFVSMTPAQAAALIVSDELGVTTATPAAVVTVDGGGGYWNPHPGDDPMGMVIDELIPMLQRRGLGRSSRGVAVMGISMGGFGALAMAEHYPQVFCAVAAISPAVWATYAQARGANAGAFASAAVFAEYDVISHASALGHTPVRVASGTDDPFHPGVVQLIDALPRDASTYVGSGCHTAPFFLSQEPASISFLRRHLA